MTLWIVGYLIGLTVILTLNYAANGGRIRTGLDRHANSKTHRRQMTKAALCMEAAEHWSDILVTERFVTQAWRICDDCGCPPDCWPVQVLRIHVGVGL